VRASNDAHEAQIRREQQIRKQLAESLARAQITQSRFLASLSQQETDAGNMINGILLALEALPRSVANPDRPYVPEAEAALFRAVQENRELQNLQGHTDPVNSAAFSADGTRIVTASSDYTAQVWDAASGLSLVVLQGHTDAVTSVAFSADGARIVTASYDHTVRVWNAASGLSLALLRGHTTAVW
jgi:WD40 repeat protein